MIIGAIFIVVTTDDRHDDDVEGRTKADAVDRSDMEDNIIENFIVGIYSTDEGRGLCGVCRMDPRSRFVGVWERKRMDGGGGGQRHSLS